jgi:hypothetical protein
MRHVALHITSTHLARAHSRRHGPTTLATRAPSQRQWSPWTANPPPASRRERQSDEPSTTSPAQPTFRCQTARRRVVHPPHMANRTARGNAWDGGRAGERNEPDDAMDHHMNAARARRETKTPARALDHGRRNNWTSTFLSREVPWTLPGTPACTPTPRARRARAAVAANSLPRANTPTKAVPEHDRISAQRLDTSAVSFLA